MRIGSVCSGIGGLELGLERAGLGPVAWQIEIDPYARAVLARHWPDAVRHEDLIDVATRPTVLSPVDVICGGTPCQDLSLAGRGAGLDGARSGLWFSMLAIVTALRPRYVVWENVAGCVRRGLERVVGGLRDLDYTVVGTRLRASDVGAPHKRERVFGVAAMANAIGQGQLQPSGAFGSVGGRAGDGRRESSWHDVADADQVGCDAWKREEPLECHRQDRGKPGDSRRPGVRPWPAEPEVGRMAHGVPSRAHRLAALGNAVVPQCAEIAGRLIVEIEEGRVRL